MTVMATQPTTSKRQDLCLWQSAMLDRLRRLWLLESRIPPASAVGVDQHSL
ncbi:hypothetical protein AM1_A0200 (plasmid) [Acaryochloris marina MBIC11017]|uniref:Uncharacterized protein n=1 Tax=Acaryochloris marina (strain MBIC 11017) TaxID=329726 RepID=A8ZKK4_ACAM1|nr:hypothetical protein AM1_A0200 [Acaryochloris marina MBIC11017]